jgi:hypothetical protein
VSVFAYLFGPIGFLVVLVMPGALTAASLAYLHRLTRWRRLTAVVYGVIANYCFFPLISGGLTTISIYAGLTSLGLAALCIESRRGGELSLRTWVHPSWSERRPAYCCESNPRL